MKDTKWGDPVGAGVARERDLGGEQREDRVDRLQATKDEKTRGKEGIRRVGSSGALILSPVVLDVAKTVSRSNSKGCSRGLPCTTFY